MWLAMSSSSRAPFRVAGPDELRMHLLGQVQQGWFGLDVAVREPRPDVVDLFSHPRAAQPGR
jgi:hypothetical protein